MNVILTGILTAMGDSRTPLKANVVGLVLNMILDPILIFGVGPVKGFGVAGAAAATVFAQAVVTLVFIIAIRKDKLVFDKVRLTQRVPWDYMSSMIRIGFPASVQNLIYTSISMILTRFVAEFGDTAVAVLRVGGQIESISWMTADGFAAAINSFVGQNYGAKQYGRVKKGYFTAVAVMFLWGLFCTFLLIVFPKQIFGLFIHEADVIPMGVRYLVILGVSQMFMCVELTTVGALSGLGKTLLSSVISIVFTTARIPLAMFLGSTSLGLDGIWWAFFHIQYYKGNSVFPVFYCGIQKDWKTSGKKKFINFHFGLEFYPRFTLTYRRDKDRKNAKELTMKRKVQIMYHKNAGVLRRLFCGIMISAMVCTQTVPVFATSKAEKEKQEAQKKLNEANKQAQDAANKKNAAQNQVSKLTTDLTALLSDIKVLENDMANKEKEIKQAESDYQEAKKEEEKQYLAMKKRIQYMYEKGDTEYMDIFCR